MGTTEGYAAAGVLLDAIVAAGPGYTDHGPVDAALTRLHDLGVVRVSMDDETDVIDIDASDLVGGTIVLLQWLVSNLAVARGVSEEVVVFTAREFLDTCM
jgi:hypothetical protein